MTPPPAVVPPAAGPLVPPCARLLLHFLRRDRTIHTVPLAPGIDGTAAAGGKALAIMAHGHNYPPMLLRTRRLSPVADPLVAIILRKKDLPRPQWTFTPPTPPRETLRLAAECVLNLLELALVTRSPGLLHALIENTPPDTDHLDAWTRLGWRWTDGGNTRDGLKMAAGDTELVDPLLVLALDQAFSPARIPSALAGLTAGSCSG